MEMSTFVYIGGGGGFAKSLRSFLGQFFLKRNMYSTSVISFFEKFEKNILC